MEIMQGIIITIASTFIIWLISSNYKKYNFKKKQELFIVLDTKITQKANYPCITVRFNSNDAVVEFQKKRGKLVGIDGLTGWVRQDCPILQKYINSWRFKIKRLLCLKHK